MNRNLGLSATRAGVFCLVLVAALFILSGQGHADEHKELQGVWIGSATGAKCGGALVTLTLNSARKLRYGSPLHCQLQFERSATPGATAFHAGVASSNGGKCDAMIDGRISVEPSDDGRVTYTLTNSDGQVWDKGVLAPDR
jgi:hypothetical protein